MEPFVLLDDARAGRAVLYRDPVEVIATDRADEVRPLLDRLRDGGQWAGFLAYEAGAGLDPAAPPAAGGPLLWFAKFERVETVDAGAWLPDPAGGRAGAPVPRVSRAEHLARIDAVQAAIRAGDIYQANLTFHADVPVAGSPLALYAGLRRRQRMPHGAVVWTGTHWILSASPELFVELDGDSIVARPMKGTAAPDAPDAALAGDAKQRAENLMIVDLLRNDLSRVAVAGSVQVPRLFAVERYPTVAQMVSEVTATLRTGLDAVDLIAAAFPCGSITGTPKLKAQEILARLEEVPRGVYTGSIGAVGPERARLNVAIRTLVLEAGAATASIGLGSAVVADSDPAAEWAECLAKGAFVASPADFDLIETMGFDAMEGFVRLDRHIARMGASAKALGFAFDRHAARNELQAATFRARENRLVRLLLSRSGAVSVEVRPCPPPPSEPVPVTLAPLPVPADDLRLRHKTTARGFYDRARREGGGFEVLFVDAEGRLTEGSFTSLFVERGGRLLTSPLPLGLLPGVLRQALIEEGRAVEAVLTPDDLRDGFLLGNSARGLLRARLASL